MYRCIKSPDLIRISAGLLTSIEHLQSYSSNKYVRLLKEKLNAKLVPCDYRQNTTENSTDFILQKLAKLIKHRKKR